MEAGALATSLYDNPAPPWNAAGMPHLAGLAPLQPVQPILEVVDGLHMNLKSLMAMFKSDTSNSRLVFYQKTFQSP